MILMILALYFLWRILILWFSHPLNLFLYTEEEFYRGFIGSEIINGLKLPFYSYRADDYSGGSLWIGTLAAGFFKTFGENAFVFKLIPTVLFAFTLVGWYFWLARYESRQSAVLTSILLIFSPLVFTRFTLTALGDHPETMCFTALALPLFFKILEKREKTHWMVPAGLGILCGFSLWIAYISGITILTVLVFWAVQDKGFFKRKEFWICSGFFLLSFLPWILGNCINGFQGLSLAGSPFVGLFSWKNFVKRLINFRQSSLYLMFAVHQLPGVVPEFSPVWITRFYRAMLCLPPLLLFFKAFNKNNIQKKIKDFLTGHSPVTFSIYYIALFLFVCQCTPFKELRYFIPVQPFLFFVAVYSSLKLGAAMNRRKWILPAVYSTVLVSATLLLHLNSFYPQLGGLLFRINPTAIDWFLLSPECANPEPCLETYRKMSRKNDLLPTQGALLRSGVAHKLLQDLPFKQPIVELNDLKKRAPDDLRPAFNYYFGFECLARLEVANPGQIENFLKAIELIAPLRSESAADYEQAFLGLFRESLPFSAASYSLVRWLNIGGQVPAFAQPEFFRHLGFLWAQVDFEKFSTFSDFKTHLTEALVDQKPEFKVYFLQGVGQLLYSDWYLRPLRPRFHWKDVDQAPAEISTAIFEGVGYGWASTNDLLKDVFREMIKHQMSPKSFINFEKGILIERDYYKGFYRY